MTTPSSFASWALVAACSGSLCGAVGHTRLASASGYGPPPPHLSAVQGSTVTEILRSPRYCWESWGDEPDEAGLVCPSAPFGWQPTSIVAGQGQLLLGPSHVPESIVARWSSGDQAATRVTHPQWRLRLPSKVGNGRVEIRLGYSRTARGPHAPYTLVYAARVFAPLRVQAARARGRSLTVTVRARAAGALSIAARVGDEKVYTRASIIRIGSHRVVFTLPARSTAHVIRFTTRDHGVVRRSLRPWLSR